MRRQMNTSVNKPTKDKKKNITLADVIRFVNPTSGYAPYQLKAFKNIMECKTKAMGEHRCICTNDECRHIQIHYDSCRDRSCNCQWKKQHDWNIKMTKDKFPTTYFHLTLTMPHETNPIYEFNKAAFSSVLLYAAKKTTMEGIQEQWGLKGGATAVVHTWGSALNVHPHVHLMVPCGGFDDDGNWKRFPKRYLANKKVLAGKFKKFFNRRLKKMVKEGKIKFPPELNYLEVHETAWMDFIQKICAKKWHADVQDCSGREEAVLKYLARYTNRLAISSSRILSLSPEGMVSFKFKKYKNKKFNKDVEAIKTISASEFVSLFAKHIPEKGQRRISHFGICGNSAKKKNLEISRETEFSSKETPKELADVVLKMESDLEVILSKEFFCEKCGDVVEECIDIYLENSA
jgi:hypothetical protein